MGQRAQLISGRTDCANKVISISRCSGLCSLSGRTKKWADTKGGCSAASNDEESIFNLALGVCPLRGKGHYQSGVGYKFVGTVHSLFQDIQRQKFQFNL